MNEAIEQQKESLENIINAVTAKDDIVLSLEESKRRVKAKQRSFIDQPQQFMLSLQDQKRLERFLKRNGSFFHVLAASFIKGFFFAAGVLLFLYLLDVANQQQLIESIIVTISSAVSFIK